MPVPALGEHFVLRLQEGRFYHDYQKIKHEIIFHWVGHLACAKPFTEIQLAKSFQRFLADNGVDAEILLVKNNRIQGTNGATQNA